jgi:hypothetical protein
LRVLVLGEWYYIIADGGMYSSGKRTATMPDDVEDKKVHGVAKSVSIPSRKPDDGDLTCSESQIEDILSEGESSKPMSKSDKGLHTKRQLKPSR